MVETDGSGRRVYPLYRYPPSMAAAIIFCVIFCITTVLHSYQMVRKRHWFLIPLVLGCYCELVGYACRASSATQPFGRYTLMPFVIQNSYILLAPALFAATIYMILGRVIRLTDGDRYSVVRSRKMTFFYLMGDIFCFALQGGGGSLVSASMTDPNSSKAAIGSKIILAGIILQTIWFVFFVAGAAHFHIRMRAVPTGVVLAHPRIRWQAYLNSLYLVSGLVIIRSIFRLAEYAQGYDGYLQSHEVFFYILDSLPMAVLAFWMNWQHPGEIALLLRENISGGNEAGHGLSLLESGVTVSGK